MTATPTKRRRLLIPVALLVALVLISSTLSCNFLRGPSIPKIPRLLVIGDSWGYRVYYPDGESFSQTESLIGLTQLNGTNTYIFLRDDPQHISTTYLWITTDWREVETVQPHIGNLEVNSSVTYSPPITLFRLPFRVGDKWAVNTKATVVTELHRSRIKTVLQLTMLREVQWIDDIPTPAGTFRAFRVTTSVNDSLSEIDWFDTSLGQVVKAEYYNDQETVTQILVAYREIPSAASSIEALYASGLTTVGNASQVIFTTTVNFLAELKIPHV